jgi:hypothetical protein
MTKPSSKLTDIILARARARPGSTKRSLIFRIASRAEASKVWIVGVAIAFNYGTPVPSDIAYFIENSLLFLDMKRSASGLGTRPFSR